jgi:pyruvate,water dikinase
MKAPGVVFVEVKGLVASTGGDGVAMGIAHVNQNGDSIDDTPKKTILISKNPKVEIYRTIHRQCIGIITDCGGMTCHAALFAREHRLPCIVGTGNATTIIKSGDYIIMNMVTGEVRLGSKRAGVT